MRHRLFAMDTSFYHSLGTYRFEARCEMLQALGYDATYLTLWSEPAWADVPLLATVPARYGLDVAAVYVTLDIAGEADHPANRRIVELVERLEGCRQVQVSVVASDPALGRSDAAGDDRALVWLERLLGPAGDRGLEITLYPHVNTWLERVEDAVRLCRRLSHPGLGLSFNGYHWYAVDGRNLAGCLAQAGPFLQSANLCGSRRAAQGSAGGPGMPATIEPLDEGELDNFAVLAALDRVEYAGMIGVQGYSVGGDVYAKLRRSLLAFRDMEDRLARHPGWGIEGDGLNLTPGGRTPPPAPPRRGEGSQSARPHSPFPAPGPACVPPAPGGGPGG